MDSKSNDGEWGWFSGDYQGASSVPERFRSTSTPMPGYSSVPPEFTSTSAPAAPAADPSFLPR